MGLINEFKNNEPKEELKQPVTETLKQEAGNQGFVLGVQNKYKLMNSDDLVVVGKINGTVHVGDAVYVSNIGDDNGSVFLTSIKGIDIGPNYKVNEATNCRVGLYLENARKQNIKCGTVIFTRNISTEAVHGAYISALGDVYVAGKDLNLSDKELDTLSITDCSEIWRLFSWFNSQNKNIDEDSHKAIRKKIDNIAKAMCTKILKAESIYCVYSKITGEPHLFSRTLAQQDGTYMCTPPDIMILTKAYKNILAPQYPQDKFEIKEIVNGVDKKEIENFLGSAFYLNGASGISVISEQTSISAEMLVPKPDFSNVNEISIPVMNPDLERWLLLIAQLGLPDTGDEELIYKLYFNFMQRELIKAKFLVPMKHNGEIPPADENGKTVLKEGMSITFSTIDGKYGRPAIQMYTDWKRLRAAMGEGWKGFIQTIDGMIDIYDCAINLKEYDKSGCYISKEMYESMKNI